MRRRIHTQIPFPNVASKFRLPNNHLCDCRSFSRKSLRSRKSIARAKDVERETRTSIVAIPCFTAFRAGTWKTCPSVRRDIFGRRVALFRIPKTDPNRNLKHASSENDVPRILFDVTSSLCRNVWRSRSTLGCPSFFFAQTRGLEKSRKAKEKPRPENVNSMGGPCLPWGVYAECLIPLLFFGRRSESQTDSGKEKLLSRNSRKVFLKEESIQQQQQQTYILIDIADRRRWQVPPPFF